MGIRPKYCRRCGKQVSIDDASKHSLQIYTGDRYYVLCENCHKYFRHIIESEIADYRMYQQPYILNESDTFYTEDDISIKIRPVSQG